MQNRSGELSVDGAKIYYELSGNPDGTPLLMLHGGLGSLNELSPLHHHVGADHLLISVDFRGHGKSLLGKQPLSYQQYQLDLQHLLNHLGVDKYAIFGFSDGGVVGYRLAAQAPDRVSCLVTLGAAWRISANDPALALLSGLTAQFWTAKFAAEVAWYEATNPRPDFPKLVDAVKAVWLDTSAAGYPDQQVEKIRCPTLVMRGDNDFLFSLDEAAALKSKIASCSFANIPLTGHNAHQESPALVGEMLQQFITHSKN